MVSASRIQLCLGIVSLFFALPVCADPEFKTFEQAPLIKEIANKYLTEKAPLERGPASVQTEEAPTGTLEILKAEIRKWHEKTEGDLVASFVRDNFFPKLKGAEEMAYGKSIATKSLQLIEMQTAESLFEKVWEFRNTLQEGGSIDAGSTAALLIRRFASRGDIYTVAKETDTTPLEDLKIDIGKLPKSLAYRIAWALSKLHEFQNPEKVRWTPNAHFQLGKENQAFIQGFLRIQFSEANKPSQAGPEPVQAGLFVE